MAATDQSSLL